MGQVRFYTRSGRAPAEALFDRLDARFADEGWPVSLSEVDEKAELFEASVYFEDADTVDETAVRHGAGVEHEVASPKEAYAKYSPIAKGPAPEL